MINETSTANRNDTSSPPCWPFSKSPRYSKIRHFSPHTHTIIRYPQSQTLSTLRYHTLIFIRTLTQQTLLVLFKCIEIIAIRILHPCQIQQRPKLRARLIETFKDSQQKFKSRDTHTEEKGLTINEQCTTIATTLGKEIDTEKPPVTPQRDLGHDTSVTHLHEPVTNIQQTLDHNHTNWYKP